MNTRQSILIASLLVVTLQAPLAQAQKKVPGEKWRQTQSLQMEGMSMPERTTELCIPIGKSNESLYKSQDPNCTMYDLHASGNTFSAKMRCTGKDAMEGSLESISEGNRTRGTMQMKSKDGQMSMKFDNTKLGTACEALDYSDYKPPVGKAAPAGDADLVCRNYAKEIEQDPAKAASYASLYAGAGATCGKSPAQKTFCTAAQSHRGFVTLDLQERRMVKAMAGSGSDGAGSVDFHPLTLSLGACGLGATPAATETLRQTLRLTAAAQNEWEFLLGEGDENDFRTVVALAKQECSGRAFTSATNPRYTRLCGQYGTLLVKGDRAGVMSVLTGECSGDCGTSGGTSGAASTSAPSAAGPEQQPAKDSARDAAREKAKDAVDKGKKLLRGILGGG